jgi:tetratricopeptide (TPR) repeat protein
MQANEDEISQALASLEVAFGAKKEGDLDAARVFFARALLKIPKTDDSYPICLSQLAEIEEHNEDWLQALRFNLNLLVEFEQRSGERDEKTIATMDKAASLFEKIGRKDESVALYERARSLSERSLWADQANEVILPGEPTTIAAAAQSTTFDAAPAAESTIVEPTTAGSTAAESTTAQRGIDVPGPSDQNSVSMIMLQAFENAYKPYLTPELIGPEDISLDALDRKLNLKGRLSKIRLEGGAQEPEQNGLQKFMAAMRARCVKAFEPLFRLMNRHLNERNRILVTVLIATPIMIYAAFFFFGKIRVSLVTNKSIHASHRFVSADGQKAFGWLDRDFCELISGPNRNKIRARVYRGQAANLMELAFAPIIQKQVWITRQPGMYVDQTGGVMYGDAGPESRIIETMQAITRGATYVYLKTSKYPESFGAIIQALTDHEPQKLALKDEYTGGDIKPIVKSINFAAKTDREGDQWRMDLMSKFKAGELIDNEPKFTSGEPRGYSVTVRIPRGTIKYFLTRAADHNGVILRGNASHAYNYFASDDGHELKPDRAEPFFAPMELKPRVVWVIEAPLSDRTEWLVHNAGAILSFVGGVLLAGSFLSTYKKGFWKNSKLAGAILLLLLSVAYYTSPLVP